MTKDEYFELLEEQQEHEIVLHRSRIDADVKEQKNDEEAE